MRRGRARQVERIPDEGSGNHRGVIVRMKLLEKDKKALLGVVANANQRRALLLSATSICNCFATSWRRGRDSNPRYGSPYNCLAGSPVRPLRHLSVGVGWDFGPTL